MQPGASLMVKVDIFWSKPEGSYTNLGCLWKATHYKIADGLKISFIWFGKIFNKFLNRSIPEFSKCFLL